MNPGIEQAFYLGVKSGRSFKIKLDCNVVPILPIPMPLTADSSLSRLIDPILATELLYGERAYGPCFLLDLKLFSDPNPPQSVAASYKLVQEIYAETPIVEVYQEALLSTIDRDQASESWNAEDEIHELQPEHFKEWLNQSLLAEEYYETENSETENPEIEDSEIEDSGNDNTKENEDPENGNTRENDNTKIEDTENIKNGSKNENENQSPNAYVDQQTALTQLTDYIQPLLFPDGKAIKCYCLTDTNNENTPYGVYLAIGQTHTLLVVSYWIL